MFLTWGRLTHNKPMQPPFIYETTHTGVDSVALTEVHPPSTELGSTNGYEGIEVRQTAAAIKELDKSTAKSTAKTNNEGRKDGEENT